MLHGHSTTFSSNLIFFKWAKYSSSLRYARVLKHKAAVYLAFSGGFFVWFFCLFCFVGFVLFFVLVWVFFFEVL